MISATLDFSKIEAKLDAITKAAGKATRPAAQAGAQVFYDEMRARVPVSAKPHKSGKKTYNPGTLRKAIYQAYVEKESGDSKAATASSTLTVMRKCLITLVPRANPETLAICPGVRNGCGQPSAATSSAICTALSAAPLRILSETTHRSSPRGCEMSSRMRPTKAGSRPEAWVTGVG